MAKPRNDDERLSLAHFRIRSGSCAPSARPTWPPEAAKHSWEDLLIADSFARR
jgi:hypothetical protein